LREKARGKEEKRMAPTDGVAVYSGF